MADSTLLIDGVAYVSGSLEDEEVALLGGVIFSSSGSPLNNSGLVQYSFRGRNDDGNEAAATWIDAADTNWSQTVDETFRARFLVKETSGDASTTGFEWQCKLNAGDWESVHTDTAWDLDSVGLKTLATLSISNGATSGQEAVFSSDGTKAYVACGRTSKVWQYPLSTAWDLSSMGAANASVSIITEDSNMLSLAFSTDGMKMYIVGNTAGGVWQYPLVTAWDLTTVGASNQYKAVTGDDATPTGLAFSSDGLKMYIAGFSTDTIYQYPLTIAWNINSAGATNASKSIAGEETQAQSVSFSSDGSKMYIVGRINDTVYQYPLTTDWDLSTAGATNASKLISGETATVVGVTFSGDGLKMYITDPTNIWQYPLSPAWDLSTAGATNATKVTYTGDDTTIADLAFSIDGFEVYILGDVTDTVYQYTLSTAFDLSSAGASVASKSIGEDSALGGLAFSSDGLKMYIVGANADTVYQYPLTIAWDLSTAGATNGNKNISADLTISTGLSFSATGNYMYVVGRGNDTVFQYTLSTPWSVSSAGSSTGSKLVSGDDTYPSAVSFSSDGLKMYVGGNTTDAIYQYTLSSAWLVSTAGASTKSYDTSRYTTGPFGIVFNDDGTKMYIAGNGEASVFEFSLVPVVKPVNSTNLTDAADTTQQIGSGTFVTPNAGVTEDGINEATASFAGNDESEFEAALQLNSTRVSATDTVQLRLVAIDGALIGGYSNTPTITALGPGIVIDVPTGALTLTGLAPTVSIDVVIDIPTASLTLTGLAPDVTTPTVVDIPTGALTLTGLAPQVNTATVVDIPVGALALTGVVPTVALDVIVDIPTGAVTLTGLAPDVVIAVLIDVPTGALTLTGLAPDVAVTVIVDVPTGALTLTGLAPTVTTQTIIDVPAGSLTLTGLVPTIQAAIAIDVPTGSLALTGLAPAVTFGTIVDIPTAALALTGLTPSVQLATIVNIPAGNLTLTGLAPTVQADVVVNIPPGALGLTGLVPSVSLQVSVEVPTGSLALVGSAPIILVGTSIDIPTGSLTLSGLVPSIATTADISIPAANLTLTGQQPWAVIAPAPQPGDVAANTIVRVQSEGRIIIVQAGPRTTTTPVELRVVKY